MRGLRLRARMQYCKVRHWWPLAHAASRPDVAQQAVLRRLLARNHDTRFGTEHGFAGIRAASAYREQVPVQSYETLHPYIEDQRCNSAAALTAEPPVFYAQTSGTTGAPKYLPVTATTLAMHRTEQALFSWLQYRACPGAFDGKSFGIMGAAVEGRLDSGHAVGSVSGHLYQSLPRAIQSRFVVPPVVSTIADYDLKYLIIVRLALAAPDITYMGTPNPSTFLRLLDVLNAQRDLLADSVASGRFDVAEQLSEPVQREIAARLGPDPGRAAQLRGNRTLTYADLWPDIRLVTTWTGGSCGIAVRALRGTLPGRTRVMELGYQSSEFRGSLALEAETPGGLPPLHHHYFEFVEAARWDGGNPVFLSLEELKTGRHYYVLVTTAAGLYRYFMNDLEEVTGFFRHTPLLRFVQKGRGVTNLTGEKLYEAQVIQAVQDAAARHRLTPRFFLFVADEESLRYRLYMELNDVAPADVGTLASEIDRHLGILNIEYQAKRSSSRLAPLTLAWLRHGTADIWKAACVRAGQREGQYKPVVLSYQKALVVPLGDYVVS